MDIQPKEYKMIVTYQRKFENITYNTSYYNSKSYAIRKAKRLMNDFEVREIVILDRSRCNILALQKYGKTIEETGNDGTYRRVYSLNDISI